MASIELINTAVTLIVPILLMAGFTIWRKDQRVKLDMERSMHEEARSDRIKIAEESRASISIENNAANYDHNNEGYIVLECPDERKSIFHDLLKGFEEYAKLKGYRVSFSADNSIIDKIAFKFTLHDSGINVSTEKVRKDIYEYINKIKDGESFDNIPQLISKEEHDLVLTTLKNRINFLEHSEKLQSNTLSYYENLLNRVNDIQYSKGLTNTPTVFVQTGGNHSPQLNSGNTYTDNSDNSTKIKISKSFNTIRDQISKLDEIRKLIRVEENIDKASNEKISQDKQDEIVKNILTIKEQLETKEEPDESLIKENLKNTKKLMDGMILSHKTSQAIEWLGKSFEFISNIELPI